MYKNIMWEPYKVFECIGEPEQFTLSPDTYLFVCNGGEGGICPGTAQRHNFGGTTYGILDLDHTQTFYACVGGNGENATQEEGHRSMGGYNGGGNGGLHLSGTTAWNGAGGGGGSDIRLSNSDEPGTEERSIPDEYDELDYIEASNNNQYIDTGYIHKSNTKIEIVCDLTVNDRGYQTLFGARTAEAENSMCFFVWMRGNNETCYAVGNSGRYYGPSFTFNQKVKVTAYNNICKWENMQGTEINRITNSYNNTDGSYSMYIMDYNQQNVPGQVRASGKLYSVKIWTGDLLERYMIPYSDPTTGEVGMYDLVYNVKYPSATGTNFIPGNVVSEKTVFTYTSPYSAGLLTRIMVGGGGGAVGIQNNNDNYQDFVGWGGGPSGCMTVGGGSWNPNKVWGASSQTSGYDFGVGGNAYDRTNGGWTSDYGDHGAGGGGGGWYGGYVVVGKQASSESYDACAGGGGSAYVLTPDSYKPQGYMVGFGDIMESLYFRDFAMLPRQAFNGSSIVVYKQATSIPLVGDTLRIPYTSEGQDFTLVPGNYRLKCWGGDGAVRYRFNNRAKGGYAEGLMSINEVTQFSGRVGHSAAVIGIGISAANHDLWFDNKMTYNGNIGSYNNYQAAATAGGGATDIRLIPKPHKIPDEYDQVEYIESYSRQYIDTGHYFNASTTKYEFVLYIPDPTTVADPPPSWCTLFGENNETAGDFSTMYYFNFREADVNKIAGGIRSDWVNTSTPITYDRKIRLVTTARGIFKWYDMDDNQLGSISIGNYSFTAPYSTILFGYNDGGTPHCSSYYRLYSFKVYENDTLVRWYIPFRSKPDAEVVVTGLYDIINDVLYPNPRDEYPFLCGDVVEKTEYNSDQESLLSRIIVAGGGGGQGRYNSFGGAGGGTSGNWCNDGWGTNNGPGTQTGTPAQSPAGGGFGYNGVGRIENSGYGGSGGNGWYGGNGTIPDGGGDDDKGGCGGSGYVLTETSYKPTGYIPDERYWLTETVLTTGGNATGGLTQIIIEPERVSALLVIAQDQESYKAYDADNDTWETIVASELNPEAFNEYGVTIGTIKSDNGLSTSYRFFVYDKYNIGVDYLSNHVIPYAQHVLFSELTTADILSDVMDYDNDENTTITSTYTVSGVAERRAVNVDICFDMSAVPTKSNTVYIIQFQTRNKPSSYYYYPGPREKEPYDAALLYVGNKTDVPSRYKPYIGGFMPDGTTAISTVENVSSCEYKRNIYSVSLLNNSVLRFTRFNIIENKSYIIRDNIPKSTLDGYVSGSLLVDDNYMYLIKSYNQDFWQPVKILRVPFDTSVSYTTYAHDIDWTYMMNCYGKAFWLDNTTICMIGDRGFLKFNTKTLSFSHVNDSVDPNNSVGTRNDWAIGTYLIFTFWYDATCTGPRVYLTSDLSRTTTAQPTFQAGIKSVCYDNDHGVFYVVMKGRLYTIRDKSDYTMELVSEKLTPFSTLTPKTINYSNGLLYVTMVNSTSLFMYNISADQWTSIPLPFTQTNHGNTGQYRPTCFKGFFFIGQLKLFVTNFNVLTKYRIGQKSNSVLIQTNSNYHNPYTYDERFITIDESGINFHDGYIEKNLEVVDPTNRIMVSEDFNKSEDYKIMLSYEIGVREEEEENNEQE